MIPVVALEKFLTDLGPDWYLTAGRNGGFSLLHMPMTLGATSCSRRCQTAYNTDSIVSLVDYVQERRRNNDFSFDDLIVDKEPTC